MGFKYLGGKQWKEITREERFFCQRLYELINREGAAKFVSYLNTAHKLDVSPEGEWEVGFEVCFYRDLWQYQGKKKQLFSPKRTFDLCLFGEKAIVIIEAKAAVGFDEEQLKQFAEDEREVKSLTGVEKVRLVGLCSSRYRGEARDLPLFSVMLEWNTLAERYTTDGKQDAVMLRADEVYNPTQAFQQPYRHSSTRLSGAELIAAFQGKPKWWVGRSGGLSGERFQTDLQTGQWREQRYEVNTTASAPPSPNYFELKDFKAAVVDDDAR